MGSVLWTFHGGRYIFSHSNLHLIYCIYYYDLGVPIVQLMEKLWKHVESLPATSDVPSGNSSHLPPPERLEWTVESSDLKRIEDASEVVDNLVKDLDFQVGC